jgi:chemotaxis protein MotB
MSSGKGPQRPIIVVKKRRAEAAAHHGGAWKVAYADFVTAMMAFFLVLWLVTAISKEQRAAVFDYFKNPSMEPGKSAKPAPGQMGPGGASTSPINLGGGLDAPRTTQSLKPGVGVPTPPSLMQSKEKDSKQYDADKIAAQAIALEKAQTELEKKRMEALMDQLKEAISKSQALEPFKDQLLLDITPEGLRIQIVDAQNRPMFDIGSAKLKGYTATILHELTPYLISVPNRISLTGHTDTTPYAGITGYTNWDLSTDRANAARRALEGSGLATERVSRVVGLSSSVLFDRANPRNPINRRISIVVLTKEAEQEALKTDVPTVLAKSDGGGASAGNGAAVGPGAAAVSSSAAVGSGSAIGPSSTVGPDVAAGPGDPNGSAQLALAGPKGQPLKASGPLNPIDQPINPPMGAKPVPVPTSTQAPAKPVTPAQAPAPRHPIPSK